MGTILNRRRVLGGKSLPYDAEIEYLQSTGTQWIDTGIQCGSNVVLTVVGRFTENVNGADFGYINSNPLQRFHFGIYNSKFIFGVGSSYTNNVYYDTNTHTFVLNGNGTAKLDSSQYSLQTFNNSYKGNIYLFARNDNGVVHGAKTKFALNRATIVVNGVTVRDYIPVRIGITGYLYDKISGQLFGSNGFILGPDKKSDGFVWIQFNLLKGSPISKGNNCYSPQWNDIPIYAVAATNNSNNMSNCRGGLSPNPKQDYISSSSVVPARIWLSGYNTNQLSYRMDNISYDSGWKTFSQADWVSEEISVFNVGNITAYAYYNNEASKISQYDKAGAGLIYFYVYQTNFPINNFYALISSADLYRILGL